MEKKIRSITLTRFNYIIYPDQEEEVDDQGIPSHFTELDPNGHPLKEISYNTQGDFEEMFEYRYDERGHLVRESYYPAENELAEEKSFVRNEAGLVMEGFKHYQDGSVDTLAYEYNETGQVTKITTTTDEGETEQVETFEWEGEKLVGHKVEDGQGEEIAGPDFSNLKQNQTRVTYNDNDQVITEEELDEEGEVIMAINRTYDEGGRSSEVDVFIDGQGKTVTRHYFLRYDYTFYD
jgi:hypothetical protein